MRFLTFVRGLRLIVHRFTCERCDLFSQEKMHQDSAKIKTVNKNVEMQDSAILKPDSLSS